jgi:hypothetical protein
MEQMFDEVFEMDSRFRVTGDSRNAAEILNQMEELTKKAPKRKR